MAIIELDGLVKQYGDVTALNGLDMTVNEGEIFGFLGPNGAGKSTTINIMLDFVRPTAGKATVLGMDAQVNGPAVRDRTGVLPEGYHVYDRLTGRQHVNFVSDSKDVDADPGAVLDRVGLEDAIDRKAGGYSKGMKQRLALGMALVGEPDLLLLDEPSTGLDPSGVRDVREVVREESERGTTIFFSSHILSQVEAVCDRVGILRNGNLVAIDSIDGLRDAVGTKARLLIDAEDVSEDMLESLRSIEGVSNVKRDGRLIVTTEDHAKINVLRTLDAAGVTITDFETQESSLEELFMNYTEDYA